MNTEKKWVDYWADFCIYAAQYVGWVEGTTFSPAKLYTKAEATELVNEVVGMLLRECSDDQIAGLGKFEVLSKSITWRALSHRMHDLYGMCVMPPE